MNESPVRLSFQVREDLVCVQSRIGELLDLLLVFQVHALEDFDIFAELIQKALLSQMHVHVNV